jgi:hypothetical protein
METKVTSHIVKGFTLGTLSILIAVIVHTFNLYENSYTLLATYGPFFIGIIISCILFSNQNQNRVTFGNIFAHGFKTTSVIIVILVLYTVLAIKLLFPEIVDLTLNITRKDMLKQSAKNPKLTIQMIEESIKMSKEYFTPFAIGGTILIYGFLGLISSLIGAAVAKKNTNPFENAAV